MRNISYQSTYSSAIQQLRAAGYTVPLVIDASGWGQSESYILNNWQALLNADSQKSLLFSLHPYWKDSNQQTLQTRFTAVVNTVVANNIPFILGEGPQATGYDCNTSFPYSWVMQQCQTNQIGWLVWTWGKVADGTGGSCGTTFDVTTNGIYGSWANAWGQAVAIGDPNSIKNTSVRPPSILGIVDTQAPTAPTGVMATNVGGNNVTLIWTASTDNVGVTGYTIYNATSGLILGTSTTNSLTLTGLNCTSPYSLMVKASDAAGNVSAKSNVVNVVTSTCDTQAPSAPGGLVASSITQTSLFLNWGGSTDNVSVTGYQVYQNGALIGTSTGISYVVSGLACNGRYTFTVKAVDAAGNISQGSTNLSVSTLACPVGEVIYADALNANWADWSYSANRNYSATAQKAEGSYSMQVDYGGWGGFAVHRTTALTATANMVIKFWAYSTGANQLAFTVQNLDGGTTSSVVLLTTVANQWTAFTVPLSTLGNPTTIQRIDIKNNSANNVTVYLDHIRFDTQTTTTDTQAPIAPSGLIASGINQTGMTLTWSASTDNVGVTGYQVYKNGVLLNGSVTGTSLAVSGLSCGTAYQFSVKAFDAAGNVSAASNLLTVSTTGCDTQAPSIPTGLTAANLTASSLTLNWFASSDNVGVAGYQVYQNGALLGTTTGISYPVSGLSCGNTYQFTVKAYDAAGNVSAGSSALTISMAACSVAEMIYDDALNGNWAENGWSWSVGTNANNTNPVQQGGKSYLVNYSGNGGFTLRKNSYIYPSSTSALRFWVYSTGNNPMTLYTMTDDAGQSSTVVPFNTVANQWQEVIIGMSALGNPSVIKRVNIQNNSGNAITVYFDYIRFSTDNAPPTTPTLTASGITQTGLTLSWPASTDNVGVTGYQIWQNGVILGSTTGTSYPVSGLTCGKTNQYTVKSYDAAGNVSPLSNVVTVTTTGCDTQAPSVPAGLAASNVTQTGLTLSWAASSDNVSVTGYQVWQNGAVLGNVSGTSFTVSGLSCGTTWQYSVKSYDAAGNVSALSSAITVTTSACASGVNVLIYGDALNTDWIDAPWPTSPPNYNNTNPVAVGSKSIGITMQPWDALSMSKKTGLANAVPSASSVLTFRVYTTSATTLMVYTSDISTANNPNGPTFTTQAGVWTQKSFPVSQLGSSTIRRIQFKNYTAYGVTAYFDDIQLLSLNSARLGQPEDPTNSMLVFPNPTTGQVTVQYQTTAAESVQLEVVDLLGRVVQQQTEQAEAGDNTFRMELKSKAAGLYLIRLQSQTGPYIQKIQLVR